MTQEHLLEPIPSHKLQQLSKDELIILLQGEQSISRQLASDNSRLRDRVEELKQRRLQIDEQFITLKNKFFGSSSERSKAGRKARQKSKRSKRVQLPSERYPEIPLIERHVELEQLPNCGSCGSEMADSGMTEDTEFLTMLPQEFLTVLQRRHKYRCEKCHGDIKTAPAPPRIKPQSGYSDHLIIDVALSKYCDLIPIERYCKIASRRGVSGIPPNSLIELTHYLAEFLHPVYEEIKKEVLSSKVLYADETPHRMLERGGGKSSWYLWGFSAKDRASYYEVQDTRSGDVAVELLKDSNCEYLVSDVFSGYGKAVRESNENREKAICNVYCNAHARRKFKESEKNFPDESEYFLRCYRLIYRQEKRGSNKARQIKLFKTMRQRAMDELGGYPTHSAIGRAMNYFLKNYEQLTLFTQIDGLPIDNNLQERQLRNPVIGRKTWYGNHSQKGAETTAIMFTLVESCKLVGVNPRKYFPDLVQRIHDAEKPLTPWEYKKST